MPGPAAVPPVFSGTHPRSVRPLCTERPSEWPSEWLNVPFSGGKEKTVLVQRRPLQPAGRPLNEMLRLSTKVGTATEKLRASIALLKTSTRYASGS